MLPINYWFKGQVRTASLSHSNVYEWGKIVDALKKIKDFLQKLENPSNTKKKF